MIGTRARVLLVSTVVVLASAAASLAAEVGSHLVWNGTESLPLGLYWLVSLDARPLHRGQLVAFPVPDSVRGLVHERGYLPDGSLILKRVVALPGDRVCVRDGVLVVGDRVLGRVLEHDIAGRPLPHDRRCDRIQAGEIYVAATHPRSFDSRSFGPVAVRDLRGAAKALWTR